MHHCQALLAFKVSIEISAVILMSFLLYMSYFIFPHPLPLLQLSIYFVLCTSCSICNMTWGFFVSGLFGVLCGFFLCDFVEDLVYGLDLGFFYIYSLKLYCGHLYTTLWIQQNINLAVHIKQKHFLCNSPKLFLKI